MFGTHFYNQGLRKLTIGFGQLFNNIMVQTKTGSGAVEKRMRIPLAYAPKKKFIARLDQQANLQQDREFAITLPRLGFELTGLEYDGSRKINKLQKMIKVKEGEEGKVQHYNYAPVPYNVTYSLYSFTATAENGLQIVEQILPYFQPDYTVTINVIPSMGIKRDVPITLNSVTYEDTYDGSYTNRRAVNYTLGFTAKTYLYGPIYSSKVIKEAISDVYTDTTTTEKKEERIVVVPDPTSAGADDDFGFTTTITTYDSAE